MAEKQPKTQIEVSKTSLPSNEDIVNSLVAEFTNQSLSNEDIDHKKSDKDHNETTTDHKPQDQEEHLADSETKSIPSNESDNENVDSEKNNEDDDEVNVIELEKLEANLTEEQKVENRKEAGKLKLSGNEMFKSEQFEECIKLYTEALKVCPLAFCQDRAIFYGNRAAAKLKLNLKESAIKDCTKAIELDKKYKRAYLRRAEIYKDLEKLDEALEDYKELSKMDPLDKSLTDMCNQLSIQISERNEKLKTEMLGKLKDLGNMILRPFGLSTNNFQMVQDPNSGGYSINFNQNTNN